MPSCRVARWLRGGIATLMAVLAGATALSLVPADAWWIRVLDFPRQQIAAVLAVLLLCALVVVRRSGRLFRSVIVAAAGALAVQMLWIVPYTRLVAVDMPVGARCDDPSRLSVLAVNVRYENDDSAALRTVVERATPDVLLVTEPGAWWEGELAPVEAALPHVVRQPQEDTWGMLLYSRLPLVDPEVRFLVEPDIPSIRTRLRLASGDLVWLYGVHPRPPRPGNDTDERDAELILVAREIRERGEPAIVVGDLNDVAWSRTTSRLLDLGDLRDPRIGRGPFSTFDAGMPTWFRWPLDYVFYSSHFDLCRLQLLEDVGSDHVPLLAESVVRR